MSDTHTPHRNPIHTLRCVERSIEFWMHQNYDAKSIYEEGEIYVNIKGFAINVTALAEHLIVEGVSWKS